MCDGRDASDAVESAHRFLPLVGPTEHKVEGSSDPLLSSSRGGPDLDLALPGDGLVEVLEMSTDSTQT